MTDKQSRRLAEIRSEWLRWSAVTDTSGWEMTFFFQVLEAKNQEIIELRKKCSQALQASLS